MPFDLDLIMLASFLIYGALCLYTAFRLGRETKLFDSFVLYPGNCHRDDCKDPDGFMAFMRPRLYVLGGLCLLVSAYFFLKTYVAIPKIVSMLLVIPPLGFLGWAFWFYHRAAKCFW